jgi:hypothetical protein
MRDRVGCSPLSNRITTKRSLASIAQHCLPLTKPESVLGYCDLLKFVNPAILFEKLVHSQALETLADAKKIVQPFVSLFNILKLSVSSQSGYFDTLISRCLSIPVSHSPSPKRSREEIFQDFGARCSVFATYCESELSALETEDQDSADSRVYVKCHSRIYASADIFGLNCTGVNLDFCSHYVHQSCFENPAVFVALKHRISSQFCFRVSRLASNWRLKVQFII